MTVEDILGKEKAGGSSPPVGSIPSFDARRPMTRWRGGFPPPNGHHHPQKGGGHVSQSHEDVEPGDMHLGGTLPGGTYEHPAMDPQVDKLPPLPDEVICRIAAIPHQHSEEESGS